jgi:hypothetical protein
MMKEWRWYIQQLPQRDMMHSLLYTFSLIFEAHKLIMGKLF